MNANEIRRIVLASDPHAEKNSYSFAAAVTMFAALYAGCGNLARLARFAGVELELVREFAKRLRVAGIWRADGRTVANWEGDGGEIAFWADVSIAIGQAKLVGRRRVARRSSTTPGPSETGTMCQVGGQH